MTFHLSPDFVDALESTGAHFKMRPILIEKDYWVTLVLKNLSQHKWKDKVIFKGGTSLSKAYNCIDRFSEDIDLAILKEEAMTGNQITNRIKAVEKAVITGLEYFQHTLEEKKGRNRKTFYHYPKALKDNAFGKVKEDIQLEINSFTKPVPYEEKQIQSYVGQFLAIGGFNGLVKDHGLESFSLNVLTRERTLFEKLLSLIRVSYTGPEKLRDKIRHFYDIHQVLNQPDLKGKILTQANFQLVDWVRQDDAANGIFAGDWMQHPLSESPLFKDLATSWKQVESTYSSELGELVWGNLPSSNQIKETFEEIRIFLMQYDTYAFSRE